MAAEDSKQVMVVGVDDREHSYYALQWIIGHFFAGPNPTFKLVLVHAKPAASSVLGLGGPGSVDMMPVVESDLKKTAAMVIDKVMELCNANQVPDVEYEMTEGDPKNVLCEAVEKYEADMLVVGSHGYGAIKRAVLGSVSDYCAHHAHCTVMIVKKPKLKH